MARNLDEIERTVSVLSDRIAEMEGNAYPPRPPLALVRDDG